MKDSLTRTFARYQRTFLAFTTGQKLVAVVGTAALLLAGFLVFRWAAAPSYSPLYSNLSAKDASAVVDKLDAAGTPYKLTNGGQTIMVPKDKVYSSRITLSGEGLPASSDGGYSLLDGGGIGDSTFKEQTNFKRAMEGELSSTIEAIDGVDAAVVHLALPQKQVFADKQEPATASVLVESRAGSTLDSQQVQAVVHLVASSIDGLDPAKVTVADSSGKVLTSADGSEAGGASTRSQEVQDYQNEVTGRIQTMLDKVVGPGNSSVTVTANLDFDKSVTETKKYTQNKDALPLSQSTTTEKYNGVDASGSGASGVVGPDGQMDTSTTTTGSGDGNYEKSATTSDNAVDTEVQRREAAPGSVKNLNVAAVLDAKVARSLDPNQIQALIASGVGIDTARGDKITVTSLPFDRTAEAAAAKELAAAKKADASAEQMTLIRNSGLVVAVLLILLLAWLKGRKRAKARANATEYVVEQLRLEQLERASQAQLEPSPALLALESTEQNETEEMLDELAALVERQPEDVASLLRGWLVEPK